jgi:hypothetical protein
VVGGGHEGTPIVLLVLLLPCTVQGTLASTLILFCLALGGVKDRPLAVLEIPWVYEVFVGALEIPHEDFL